MRMGNFEGKRGGPYGQRTNRRRTIAENCNRLSRVHERYRQTDDRQTDRRQHIGRSLNSMCHTIPNINTITSQQMVFFQAWNALKTIIGRGFARTPLGELTTLPQTP